MAETAQLPQLPLMLAGIPRPIADLLREAGVPVARLNREPLAAHGGGRFVLFDSRSSESSTRARQARRQGLELIDLAEFTTAFGRSLFPWIRRDSAADRIIAGEVLDRLKVELENRGGIWLRVADYPFPYQSAVALGVDHASLDATDVFAAAAEYPPLTTHFVSSRLKFATPIAAPPQAQAEWGWLVGGDVRAPSPDKHAARWVRQLARFHAAGVNIAGLSLGAPDVRLPPVKSLLELGFEYQLRHDAAPSCRMEPVAHDSRRPPWVRIGAAPVPVPGAAASRSNHPAAIGDLPRGRLNATHRIDAAHVLSDEIPDSDFTRALHAEDWVLEWVTSHYKSGTPMLLRQIAGSPHLAQTLYDVSSNASRCSLMWRTSFREFAQWWHVRSQLALQVWRTANGYEIHADGDLASFPPAIEVWRGGHVATLPLRQPILKLQDEGLVFLKSQSKRPAGFSDVHELPVSPAQHTAPLNIGNTPF